MTLEQPECAACGVLLASCDPYGPPLCEQCEDVRDEPDPDVGRGSYKDRIENPEDY